jgi:histidine triad (HIT) family protein
MTSNPCSFCAIIDKKISAQILAENDRVLAFSDINPQAPFHALIIPKVHIANCNELEQAHAPYLAYMMLMAKDLADRFNLGDKGYRLVINCGASAGQSVFHIHQHMLAGRPFAWPPG